MYEKLVTCPDDASQISETAPSIEQLHLSQFGYPKYSFLMSQLKLYKSIKKSPKHIWYRTEIAIVQS